VAVLDCGRLDTTICLHEYDKPTSNDHGSPAIIELGNRIVAFYSWHTSELFQTSYDTQSKEIKTVILDSLATYNQVFQFKSGRVVLLYNKSVMNKRTISLRYSDDGAQSWSEEIVILDPKDDEFPYFVANVEDNKIVIAYTIYNQKPTNRQHRNIFSLTSDNDLSSWYDNYEYHQLPITESKPIYLSPDSLDVNIFDTDINGNVLDILFTMFEPYYSKNRFQSAKLYLLQNEEASYISDNATTVYSTGGFFYGDEIFNVQRNKIEIFGTRRGSLEVKQLFYNYQWREIRISDEGIYGLASDSTYINNGQGNSWNTQLLFLKYK